jgi:hypothetical protein
MNAYDYFVRRYTERSYRLKSTSSPVVCGRQLSLNQP